MNELTPTDESQLQRFVANDLMVNAVRKVLDNVFLELRDDAIKIADTATAQGVSSNSEIGELLRAYGIARKRLTIAFTVLERYKKVEEKKPQEINIGL